MDKVIDDFISTNSRIFVKTTTQKKMYKDEINMTRAVCYGQQLPFHSQTLSLSLECKIFLLMFKITIKNYVLFKHPRCWLTHFVEFLWRWKLLYKM